MSWKDEVEEIGRRRELAHDNTAAPKRCAKQHERGRLTVRERIGRPRGSPDSFREQWARSPATPSTTTNPEVLVSFTPANYVLGMLARIDGRTGAVCGEDFTQRGGSPSPAGLRKSVYAEELALRYRVPLIRLLEGGGAASAVPAARTASRRPARRYPVYTTSAAERSSIGEALTTCRSCRPPWDRWRACPPRASWPPISRS